MNYHWISGFLHEPLNTCAVRDAPPARTGELLGIWRGQQFPFFFTVMNQYADLNRRIVHGRLERQ